MKHQTIVLSCTQPCTWHVAVEYLDIFKKENTDTCARRMKLFQHLYSCPFSLHADSPEDEEYHHTIVLCCFCVDCFMSLRIHFLLNLSSFTQGHTLLCNSIPQLFKTQTCLLL